MVNVSHSVITFFRKLSFILQQFYQLLLCLSLPAPILLKSSILVTLPSRHLLLPNGTSGDYRIILRSVLFYSLLTWLPSKIITASGMSPLFPQTLDPNRWKIIFLVIGCVPSHHSLVFISQDGFPSRFDVKNRTTPVKAKNKSEPKYNRSGSRVLIDSNFLELKTSDIFPDSVNGGFPRITVYSLKNNCFRSKSQRKGAKVYLQMVHCR